MSSSNIICQPLHVALFPTAFILITTSARFFSLMAYAPHLKTSELQNIDADHIRVPGSIDIPISSIPPPLLCFADNLFTSILLSNSLSFSKVKGILFNTFEFFESDTFTALNNVSTLSPIFPIGPLEPYGLEKSHSLQWLDEQPANSVLYISFGSRTAMSKDQIRALGDGLDASGHRFLWVLKGNKIDKEDNAGLDELLSDSFLRRTQDKGLVVKGWVSQEAILKHSAVGGFVSHCGWNSVMEAALYGIPVLAWPLHGDQRINAEVVEKSGLGLWEKEWGWGGEKLISKEEIGVKIKELMEDETIRETATTVGKEARKAIGNDGGSTKVLTEIINSLNPKERQ